MLDDALRSHAGGVTPIDESGSAVFAPGVVPSPAGELVGDRCAAALRWRLGGASEAARPAAARSGIGDARGVPARGRPRVRAHLHCFEVGDGSRYILGGHDELDPPAADSQTITLQRAGLARIGVKFTYTFDLGEDWTDARKVVAQGDLPDFSRAGIRARQPAGPPSSAGERSPTNTAACATTTNMIPGPIADHASSLPGEHPVARPTRRLLSATCLGASHGRSARRVPSARSRPRRRTGAAQARARA